MRSALLVVCVAPALGFASTARAAGEARLDALKALAGTWSGVAAGEHGRKVTTHATIRVVSAGSAVMLTTDPGTPHEMVTMFHEDDGALMATHYCAGQNQPRFKARPEGDARKLVFEFVDGTNLGAHPGRMQRLIITVADRDHHVEEWTYREGSEESTMRFELSRKK